MIDFETDQAKVITKTENIRSLADQVERLENLNQEIEKTEKDLKQKKKEYEKLFGGSDIPWKENFSFLNGVTHTDIDSLQIYKKAHRDQEHTCRYIGLGKEVPCKSLEYCFVMNDKTLPNKGCLDMYYIGGKIYWEPFGW